MNKEKYFPKRRKTIDVDVGGVSVGGNHPIRVQSMIVADSLDTGNAVREIRELRDVGCEIVRLTVPGLKEAENLRNIRKEMRAQNIFIPLVADIHFTPHAAMVAADYVEKVRINPGNFVDRKKKNPVEWNDEKHREELQKIREQFCLLLKKMKTLGRALRIGTNHGSLSERILSRYGDTPEGMVESAMEYLRICEEESFHNIVLSMKASDPRVMVNAYKGLVARMDEEGMRYPLHLGVTEAGSGMDGRVKSAVGIGALLEEGLGDTIRVSLTEDPVHEIPVAREIVDACSLANREEWDTNRCLEYPFSTGEYERRRSDVIQVKGLTLGGTEPVRTGMFSKSPVEESIRPGEDSIEMILPMSGESASVNFIPVRPRKKTIVISWKKNKESAVFLCGDIYRPEEIPKICNRICDLAEEYTSNGGDMFMGLRGVPTTYWVPAYRLLAASAYKRKLLTPILLLWDSTDKLENIIAPSTKMGTLLMEGIGDAVAVVGTPDGDISHARDFLYTLLQAARRRISKTEFISCPSCGRTHFEIQKIAAHIQKKTGHLKGLKIAVMGCIVNGPGEMADADFGYVGAGRNKVSLYAGRECVKRNIPERDAIDELIALIASEGKWVDP